MRKIKYAVIHHNGVPGRTVENIRRAHKAQGWNDIGYHFVIHEDGTLHQGRPLHKPGAHTAGLNMESIGICLIGNGNERDFSAMQYARLYSLLATFPNAQILGHRETGPLVPDRLKTKKTCPGTKVDLDKIRATVKAWLNPAAS